MEKLTAQEKKILNNVTQVMNPNVKLGDKIEEVIGAISEDGSPVNAIAATETLSITGVVLNGETLSIGDDVYEFLTDVSQIVSDPGNIAVDIEAQTTKSNIQFTIDTRPTSGDTMTIGGKTFIFVPAGTDTADGEISIGTDLATAQEAIVAAILGLDGTNIPHPLVSIDVFALNSTTIAARVGGTAGNLIATVETFTAASNGFGAVTLGAGADCSATDAVAAIVDAITVSDTQGVNATNGDGDTVVLKADVAGVVGNAITLETTMANASFTGDTDTLSGGINGTVAASTKIMVDETYLYICSGGNTTADANWRRIALGAVY
jgi:hypothetical protein